MIDAVGGLPRIGLQDVPKPAGGGETSSVASFASHLSDVIRAGEEAAAAGLRRDMPMQQVVETVLQAERTLTMTISVRDKVVGAYLEMTRMQI